MTAAVSPAGLARTALLAASMLLAACSQVPIGAPVASVANIQKARALSPLALGEFGVAPGRSASLDSGPTVRGHAIAPPTQNSFAQYLKETLATELRGAGRLSASSDVVLSGWLTEGELDASMSQGHGQVAARFVAVRGGTSVYDKELRASSSWESSFLGPVAIPAAANGYGGLYRQLVSELLSDEDFIKAVAR
jgi:hypothetical protein